MNRALSPPPPTPAPCLSVDPRSLRKGALSPPLSCLTLEDAPLWTWLLSSLKKNSPEHLLFSCCWRGWGSGQAAWVQTPALPIFPV